MSIFSPDVKTTKAELIVGSKKIENPAGVITLSASDDALEKGKLFACEISEKHVTDFEKTEALFNDGKVSEIDRMVHVSTFVFTQGKIFTTYYANTHDGEENPAFQRARLVFCPEDDVDNKTFIDIQAVGEECSGGKVEMLYDTVLLKWNDDTLFIMWTANVSGKYYRLYRTYTVSTNTLSDVFVNRFKVGDTVCDFSTSGIQAALRENGIGYGLMKSDIGIMQKMTSRIENGVRYYYTGTYSWYFNAIIKSCDFVTWEYVSSPDFLNLSKWENSVYLTDDKCYYFVRQQDSEDSGFLTYYDLCTKKWARPVLIADSQSRSDFIMFENELYLFHAPIDREHIGIVRINREKLEESQILLQAKMDTSCFYPFVDYGTDGSLYMSYTVERRHIRLAKFKMENYTD